MKNRMTKIMGQAAYQTLAEIGCAPGGTRGGTHRSKKDKARCPKAMRRAWRNRKGE